MYKYRIINSLQALLLSGFFLLIGNGTVIAEPVNVDTGQANCYGISGEMSCPQSGHSFHGQDGQYQGNAPRYLDNGDGTISDLNTGLMWSKGLAGRKVDPAEAQKIAGNMTLGGYADWRVPNIKELYSLIDFRGNTGFSHRKDPGSVPSNAIPFINTDYFDFAYGSTSAGERYIDAQWLSSTHYVATTMNDMDTVFGVNFADGRIKGYGYKRHGTNRAIKTFFVRFVRGNEYGYNDFVDNGDGTVTDGSTGLMWMKKDSGTGMAWREALAYAENLNYAGYNDWRLPNAKELQHIVDYSRSPDTTGSPAIDPIFQTTAITNEAGQKDFPYFWTSTSHLDGPRPGSNAAYIAFGRAIGQMHGKILDVHGAGAQRSDPKKGRAELGHGPQGDARRIENYVRCVRGGIQANSSGKIADGTGYPNSIRLTDVVVTNVVRMPGRMGMNQQQGGPGSMPGGKRGPQSRFVERLDRNGDGRISRQEFDGPPDRFDFHDSNHDGYLTDDESPQGPPPAAGNGRSRRF